MQSISTTLPDIMLIGVTARTNNQNEMNPQTAKIGPLAGRYWGQNLAGSLLNRKTPGVTFSVYTDYASNEHGDYTYFIGEEVTSFDDVPAGFETLTIPAAAYQKFTTSTGKLPDIIIQAWMHIWQMSKDQLGGQRAYLADFEKYDQRASDPANAAADIYIGLQSA